MEYWVYTSPFLIPTLTIFQYSNIPYDAFHADGENDMNGFGNQQNVRKGEQQPTGKAKEYIRPSIPHIS